MVENKDKVLVLIDADGLTYASSKNILEESIQVLNDKIQNIYEKTGATHAAFFISKGRYFRHNLDPLYKQNRGKYPTKLLWLKTLKAYLEENYQANSMNLCEADDLIAYWANNKIKYCPEDREKYFEKACILDSAKEYLNGDYEIEDVKIIISSPDKDLLQSIEGHHFNYTYKLEEKNNPESVTKGWWVKTTSQEASRFRRMQLICGDNVDNISGLSGRGIKYFEKIEGENPFMEDLLAEYTNAYGLSQGIYKFQKNYRLLHLLENNEDFLREVQELPQLPRIIEINKEITTTETTAMKNSELNELFN